jgi:hypothetical protein
MQCSEGEWADLAFRPEVPGPGGRMRRMSLANCLIFATLAQ